MKDGIKYESFFDFEFQYTYEKTFKVSLQAENW